ncbi:ATP-binding protein [Halomonas aestuarii]|uniref:ATP-binding protein n=1 Tax=Halomonas aestuarii TaxID=1897729 RepID=UPI0009035401
MCQSNWRPVRKRPHQRGGTNASGKTTLQRLVPVFSVEQLDKVVPTTRLRFVAFCLPHRLRYVVDEYHRKGDATPRGVMLGAVRRRPGHHARFSRGR